MSEPKIYLVYVKRYVWESSTVGRQILAGASFDEKQVLEWIDEGKKIGHDIFYEDIPIENASHPFHYPKEMTIYFDGCDFDEDWDDDFQWTDPVGRRALIPDDFMGVVRPRPEVEGVLREDGYIGNGQYLWRVPCPWQSRYLLAPFKDSCNENMNYGLPYSV